MVRSSIVSFTIMDLYFIIARDAVSEHVIRGSSLSVLFISFNIRASTYSKLA